MPENTEFQGQMEKDASEGKKIDSNRLEMPKSYTLKQIREIVFAVKIQSKGKLSFSEISRQCGWTASRLNQILGNFEKYFPKKKKFQDAIWEKLNGRLNSVSGIKESDEKKGVKND